MPMRSIFRMVCRKPSSMHCRNSRTQGHRASLVFPVPQQQGAGRRHRREARRRASARRERAARRRCRAHQRRTHQCEGRHGDMVRALRPALQRSVQAAGRDHQRRRHVAKVDNCLAQQRPAVAKRTPAQPAISMPTTFIWRAVSIRIAKRSKISARPSWLSTRPSELDPDYAAAWARPEYRGTQCGSLNSGSSAALTQGSAASARARRKGGRPGAGPRAGAQRPWQCVQYESNWSGAEAQFRRAAQLAPGLAGAKTNLANMTATLGRPKEGCRALQQA